MSRISDKIRNDLWGNADWRYTATLVIALPVSCRYLLVVTIEPCPSKSR